MIATITIGHFLSTFAEGILPDEPTQLAEHIVNQIHDARHNEAGALFLRCVPGDGFTVPGGSLRGFLAVYSALRDASRAGLPIVAYGETRLGSSAPVLLAAADAVVLAPGTRLHFHGCHQGRVPWPPGDRLLAQVLRDRTLLAEESIAEILRPTFDDGPNFYFEVLPDDAVRVGLADAIGDEEFARMLASAMAGGARPVTDRIFNIGRRQEAPLPDIFGRCGVAAALKTSNYAEDANGNPTAGVKLDHTGTALKVAKNNMQIGDVSLAKCFQTFRNVLVPEGANFVFITAANGFQEMPNTDYVLSITPLWNSTTVYTSGCRIVASVRKWTNQCGFGIQEPVPAGQLACFDVAVIYLPD